MKCAILDLGTNTFNLLIAEKKSATEFDVLFESKYPVRLGKGGITKRLLLPDAMDRGIHALKIHKEKIDEYKVEKVYAVATSAVRSADNCDEFVNKIKKELGFDIRVISGNKEAELIYYGVKSSTKIGNEKVLILDIGGGSNEFIIADGKDIFWKESYKLGIARLMEMFKVSDPIHDSEIDALESYFDEQLKSLFSACSDYKPTTLIGASGTFETFSMIIRDSIPHRIPLTPGKFCYDIDLKDYYTIHYKLLRSTYNERTLMKALEPIRIDYIVVATIFVNYVIKKFGIQKLKQSDFSLKEGVMWVLVNKEDYADQIL